MATTYNATQLHLLNELYASCMEHGDGGKHWSDEHEALCYNLIGLNDVSVMLHDDGTVTAVLHDDDGAHDIDPSFKNIRKLVVDPEFN